MLDSELSRVDARVDRGGFARHGRAHREQRQHDDEHHRGDAQCRGERLARCQPAREPAVQWIHHDA